MSTSSSSFDDRMTRKIKLLVAEDSQGTRHNLINLLGFEKDVEVVGAVGRAMEAIERASQLQPDVVLMDINLPDLDGLTATMRIRANLPKTAVIIMSVQDEETYLRRA